MWLAIALVSFAAFLLSAFAFTRLGFDRQGKLARNGLLLLVSTAVLLVVWIFALARVEPPYPIENLKRYEAPR